MYHTLKILLILSTITVTACRFESKNDSFSEVYTKENTDTSNITQNPDDAFLIRTYFGEGTNWRDLQERLSKRYEMGFRAHLYYINNEENAGASISEIMNSLPEDDASTFLFIADSLTFTQVENTVICVDLYDEPGRFFRVIPSELWAVENNLSISNIDYDTFYEECDEDGVYRGLE